jgi:uncharacterized membrane protein
MFALVLASGFCCSLVWARTWRTGSNDYGFLVWNLELAWIPFVLALAFYDSWRRGRPRAVLAVLGALWLLFLPNAPYMVTDLVHLGRISGAPLWYDGAMIAAFAATGLLLGLGSVFLMHTVALRSLGPRLGWALLVPVLALCSGGVVLGRFARLNSWDAVAQPGRLVEFAVHHAADPLASRRALVATLGYAVFLVLAYVVLYAVSSLRPDLEHDRGR